MMSEYGGILQRWQLIFSEHAYAREKKTWDKKIESLRQSYEKQLWHIGNTLYQCQKDAEKALHLVMKKIHLYRVEYTIEEEMGYTQKGRPKADATPGLMGYRIKSKLYDNEAAQSAACNRLGRFVLGTNDCDGNRLPSSELLSEYKGQRHNERGFQFIKDKTFCVSSVYLKKPERIDALMMVMTLCLMVYNLAQYELRRVLVEKAEALPNQLGKPTQTPTLKWIFRQLDAITVVRFHDQKNNSVHEVVSNISPVRERIIRLFGFHAQLIYGVEPS
jgi:transposase